MEPKSLLTHTKPSPNIGAVTRNTLPKSLVHPFVVSQLTSSQGEDHHDERSPHLSSS
jgi:hypothetical protein